MFYFAESFNQCLNTWDTRNAEMMHGMFYGATAFRQSLHSWDFTKVPKDETRYMLFKTKISRGDVPAALDPRIVFDCNIEYRYL